MIPQIDLYFFTVGAHQFFVGLGLVVFASITFLSFRHHNYSQRTYIIIPASACGAIVGSWASMLIPTHPIAFHAGVSDLFLYSGRSLVGGLAGAYLCALVAKKIFSITTITGDTFAFACAAGFAVGRLGCFFTEPLGTVSHLPWAIRLSRAQVSHFPRSLHVKPGIPYHPSMLYEIAFFIIFLFVLWAIREVSLTPQFRWRLFICSYAIARFLLEFVRTNRNIYWGLSGTQLFLIVVFPFIAYSLYREVSSVRMLRSLPVPTTDRLAAAPVGVQ